MKVIEGCDSRYKFLDLITLKEKDFHVSDMKPFVFDAALTGPLDIARRDNERVHECLASRLCAHGVLLLSFQFFLPPDCCLWGASLESEGISGVILYW